MQSKVKIFHQIQPNHCSLSALTGVLVSPMLNLWPSTLHTETPHLDTSALASWGMYWAGVPPVTVLHLQTICVDDGSKIMYIDCCTCTLLALYGINIK